MSLPIEEYKDVIMVSFAWVGLLVIFQIIQSAAKWYVYQNAKSKAGKKMSVKEAHYGDEARMHPYRLAADRSVGNLLEWSWVFILSLWFHAVFISTADAAWWGWTYVGVRALYPFAFTKKFVYLVTAPNYISLYMLCYPVVKACL